MPANPNLWSLMLIRWLDRSLQCNALTTVGLYPSGRASRGRELPRPGQAPPMQVERLSQHLRRDIGLERDWV